MLESSLVARISDSWCLSSALVFTALNPRGSQLTWSLDRAALSGITVPDGALLGGTRVLDGASLGGTTVLEGAPGFCGTTVFDRRTGLSSTAVLEGALGFSRNAALGGALGLRGTASLDRTAQALWSPGTLVSSSLVLQVTSMAFSLRQEPCPEALT